TATIPLWITSHTQGADLEVRTTSATGKVGDTIPVTVTVINHGPSPEPWWGIDINASGLVLVGQHGCGPGILSAKQWQCAHQAFTPVGTQVTVTFDFKIVDLSNRNFFGGLSFVQSIDDPVPTNLQLSFQFAKVG